MRKHPADSTNIELLRGNLPSLLVLLLRELLIILVFFAIVRGVEALAFHPVSFKGIGKLVTGLNHWLDATYPAFLSTAVSLFALESIVGSIRSYYAKLSRHFTQTFLSLRAFTEAAVSYLGVLFGATMGYALLSEAVSTQRGLAVKFCFYVAGFVLMCEAILLGIRYAYHTAWQRTDNGEMVGAGVAG